MVACQVKEILRCFFHRKKKNQCCLGGLNLSRAIGDHAYKKTKTLPAEEQAITALPDIRKLTLDENDEFMVIACDGIWNFMSSQDVVDYIRERLEKKSLSQICEEVS